jgi:DNA-binding MarR family transcriptional regulator
MGGLEGAIGFALRRAQIAVFDHYSELTQGLGVTPAQFAALSLIQANPGLNQVSLGEALCIEGPRTAVVIDDLERRGLVTRKAAPADRRSHAIFLTPAGRSLHKKVAKREAEHNAHMIERLRGEDKDALLRMLRLLATPF